ncbi:MAG: alpha/beta hydrolase [Acidobacteria bacterium]|nr:alpha/beta hydrolase [Acidobacteriota bacterium]
MQESSSKRNMETTNPQSAIRNPQSLFFHLPRTVRMAIYLPFILLLIFLGLRQIEFMVTYHPLPYIPGPSWTPPANGEDVWINVGGGERVHGWFVRAQTQPAFATVLLCHGNGGNLTYVAWVAEDLSGRNLDVLIFDYRGYGRSEGKITDEWGLFADTEAAYDYLIRERGVKVEKLVLYGESLGTTAAIDVASRRPCGALIVESGLSSASDMGVIALPWLPRWLHRLGKNRFESARKIANVKCPVLVTHGTDDSVIPVEQGRKLFEAAPEPKKVNIVEGGDHNLFGSGGSAYLEQIVGFIREAATK